MEETQVGEELAEDLKLLQQQQHQRRTRQQNQQHQRQLASEIFEGKVCIQGTGIV